MTRLFFGIKPDELTVNLLSGLGMTVPGARPVSPYQVHFTLRFIGEVEGSMLHDIKEEFRAFESPPVTLLIKGVGHFPSRGKPRVLWAGVEPSPGLLNLRNKINRLLKQCAISPETRKFHPHITLARLNTTSSHRVAQFLASNCSLHLPPTTSNQLTLFSSNLTKKGAIHTVEEQYSLQAE